MLAPLSNDVNAAVFAAWSDMDFVSTPVEILGCQVLELAPMDILKICGLSNKIVDESLIKIRVRGSD
jgi:hypothetical protein